MNLNKLVEYVKVNPPDQVLPEAVTFFWSRRMANTMGNSVQKINGQNPQMSVEDESDKEELAYYSHDATMNLNALYYLFYQTFLVSMFTFENQPELEHRRYRKKIQRKMEHKGRATEFQSELKHESCGEKIQCETKHKGCRREYDQYVKVNPPWPVLLSLLLLILQLSFGAVTNSVQLQHFNGQKKVFWNTKLTHEEIMGMGVKVGIDWDKSSGFRNIPYFQQKRIRFNTSKYSNFPSEAKPTFLPSNESKFSSIHSLTNVFGEVGRYDLKEEMISMKDQVPKRISERPNFVNIPSLRNLSVLPRFLLFFLLSCTVNNNIQGQYEQKQVYWNTKFSSEEITQMSLKVGPDWDKLAGLMNIPYYQQEEIRLNSLEYPTFSSKAEQVIVYYNESNVFSRNAFEKFLIELGRNDLQKEMIPVEEQSGTDREESTSSQNEGFVYGSSDNLHLPDDTPLSPREMYKLSREISDWYILAGLMNISLKRNDIQNNILYHDNSSRAGKILSIFNNRKEFSRQKLAHLLKEISQPQLIKPVITGEWRGDVGLKHECREEQFEVPKRISRRKNCANIRTNRNFPALRRFVLAFLLCGPVQGHYDRKPVYCNTKLSDEEIARLSPNVGHDWDELAGLMNIPFNRREEIRFNSSIYPSTSSKAEQVFRLFNTSKGFSRHALRKIFKEMGRSDLEIEMIRVENKGGIDRKESSSSQNEGSVYGNSDNLVLRDDTRLSPREMSKLGREIAASWYILGGLMSISFPDRKNIRNNSSYHDNSSRAEKILSIFNNREDFSRQKLAQLFKEISQQQLIKPVITGEWRTCELKCECPSEQFQAIPKKTNFAFSSRNFSAFFRLLLAFFLCDAVNSNLTDHFGKSTVYWNTKLSYEEIARMSSRVGPDWDKLAGLMNIPYDQREKIRLNSSSFSSKAKQILVYFNESKSFSRNDLKKYFKELGRYDLENLMIAVGKQSEINRAEIASSQNECSIHMNSSSLEKTPLSSRETCRLSRKIVDWNTLAGLMDIPSSERNSIRNNNLYYDDCSRAEKILSVFNNRRDFSRTKLASYFEELSELQLKNLVLSGELRSV